jgi:hypothetical protein
MDVPLPAAFAEARFGIAADDFLAFLKRFQTHRYIYHYSNDEQLLFALNRIMQRARQQPFGDEVAPAFFAGLPHWEEKLSPKFEQIFFRLREE